MLTFNYLWPGPYDAHPIQSFLCLLNPQKKSQTRKFADKTVKFWLGNSIVSFSCQSGEPTWKSSIVVSDFTLKPEILFVMSGENYNLTEFIDI